MGYVGDMRGCGNWVKEKYFMDVGVEWIYFECGKDMGFGRLMSELNIFY